MSRYSNDPRVERYGTGGYVVDTGRYFAYVDPDGSGRWTVEIECVFDRHRFDNADNSIFTVIGDPR